MIDALHIYVNESLQRAERGEPPGPPPNVRLFLTPTVQQYASHIGRSIGQAIEITYYVQPKPRQSRMRLSRLSSVAAATAPAPAPAPSEVQNEMQLAHTEDESDVIEISDSDEDAKAPSTQMSYNPPVLAHVMRNNQSPSPPPPSTAIRRILQIGEPSTSDGRTHGNNQSPPPPPSTAIQERRKRKSTTNSDNNIKKKRKSATNIDDSTIKALKVKRLKAAIAVKEAQLCILQSFTRKMEAGELTYINMTEGGLPEMPRAAPMTPDEMEVDSDSD